MSSDTLTNDFLALGMNLKIVDIDTLEPAPFNPGEHPDQQIQEIAKSLDRFQQFKNVVVWQGKVIAGKGVLESAKEKGLTQIIVNDRSDLSEEEAKALCLTDRALPSLGETNAEVLQNILAEIPDDFEIPGVTPTWLEELGVDYGSESIFQDEAVLDEVPDVLEEPLTQRGDLWLVGRHRVLCGDATDTQDIQRITNGIEFSLVLTDPPYGINQNGIPNDDPASFEKLINSAVPLLPLNNGIIISFASPRTFPVWLDATRNNGFRFERMLWLYKEAQCTFPWRGWLLKSEAILASSIGNPIWHDRHPYVHDCYKVSEVSGELPDEIGWHGSVKPLKVVEDLIIRCSNNNHSIFDGFLGSGTTLIACEKTDRVCYGLEIDEHYCDVILQRYQRVTGREDVRLLTETGEIPYAEVVAQRQG